MIGSVAGAFSEQSIVTLAMFAAALSLARSVAAAYPELSDEIFAAGLSRLPRTAG